MSRRSIWLFVALLSVPAFLSAKWQVLGPAEIVSKTDVIVVAVLEDVVERRQNGFDLGKGTLRITKTVYPESLDVHEIILEWKNETGLVCPRVDPTPYQDESAVWLLHYSKDGGLHADHPGRTISASNLDSLADFVTDARRAFGEESEDPRLVALEKHVDAEVAAASIDDQPNPPIKRTPTRALRGSGPLISNR